MVLKKSCLLKVLKQGHVLHFALYLVETHHFRIDKQLLHLVLSIFINTFKNVVVYITTESEDE
jgi:hypothetical protein